MADFGGFYSTGTLTVNNGDSTATIAGAMLTLVAEQGDWLYAGGAFSLIDTITDDTHVTLQLPWFGTNQSAASYVLVKMSWLRYEPALTQQKVREMLAELDAAGTFYFVEGAAPDVGIGNDGQWALKVNSGAWKLWYKTAGSWVLQGSPAGVQWKGLWNNVTTYVLNDMVHRSGNTYISILTSPANLNMDPLAHPEYWDLFSEAAGRYDFMVWDDGKPTSGETIIRASFALAVQFPAGLINSQAHSTATATADATFSIKKNGVQFATCKFLAGQSVGTFTMASDTNFAIGDLLSIDAPSPQDATLAGVNMTLTGFR